MTVLGLALLLADMGNWIQFLFIAALILFSLLGNLIKAVKSSMTRPSEPPPEMGEDRGPEADQSLEAKLEEFLHQKKASGQLAPAQSSAGQVFESSSSEKVVDAEIVADSISTRSVRGLDDYHFDTRQFRESFLSLDQEIDSTDKAATSHLHEKFGHSLGQIKQEEGDTLSAYEEPKESVNTDANKQAAVLPGDLAKVTAMGEISAALHNQDDLRRAIILNEVLGRPKHRW